jgi:hypothetical protein
MTPEQEVALGHQAEAMQAVLAEAFARAEAALVEKFKAVSPARVDDIRGLHACVQNIEAAKSAVIGMIAQAQIAQAERAD